MGARQAFFPVSGWFLARRPSSEPGRDLQFPSLSLASGSCQAVSGRVREGASAEREGPESVWASGANPCPGGGAGRSSLGKRLPVRRSQNPGGRGRLRSVPGPPCPPEGQRPPSLSGQLVGKEDALLQPLADSMLKEDCASTLQV